MSIHNTTYLSQDISLISNLTKDTQKTSAPIHAGETSYPVLKVLKMMRSQPHGIGFHSSSSRVQPELEPSHNCPVTGYGSIFGSGETGQNEVRVGFGSLESRFTQRKQKSPDPTTYNMSSMNTTKQKSVRIVFSSSGKINKKEELTNIGPGSYHLNQGSNHNEVRQRIRQKFQKTKEKYRTVPRKLRNSLGDVADLAAGFQEQKLPPIMEETKKNQGREVNRMNRFNLKQNVHKYLAVAEQMHKTTNCQERTNSGSHNFSPFFIERTQNPFESYIKPNCSPGPAHYQRHKQVQNLKNGAQSSFRSKVLREVFGSVSLAKPKIKLSYLL